MMKPPSRLLRIDSDEELSLEDMRDLIDRKNIMAESAIKKGEVSRANKAKADIAQYQMLIDI
jgi:hypothetical protein